MDSFFGIGIGELFFIAIIALIVLGPERLPGAIREVAKWSRMIRNLSSELTSQFSEEMKAFDELNPNKILRDLTEDPADQANKAQAGKATAKTTSKPAAKPSTASATTAKATTPKTTTPKTTPAKPVTAASSSASTEAKTPPKVPTPPMPKKRTPATGAAEKADAEAGAQSEAAVKADAVQTDDQGAAAQGEPENRILPPTTGATDAPTNAADAPAAPQQENEAVGGSTEQQENKISVDASTPHPALAVNGKSAAEGEA